MNALLFFHVLAAFVLVGGVATVAISAAAARRAPFAGQVAWWSAALVVVPGAVAAVAVGEVLADRKNYGSDPGWLEVSRALATIGLLLGGIVLAALARIAVGRPRLASWTTALASLLAALGLAVAFLMAAKP